jgi:hypothetical protein
VLPHETPSGGQEDRWHPDDPKVRSLVKIAAQVRGILEGRHRQQGIVAEDRSKVFDVGLQKRLGSRVVSPVVPDEQDLRWVHDGLPQPPPGVSFLPLQKPGTGLPAPL